MMMSRVNLRRYAAFALAMLGLLGASLASSSAQTATEEEPAAPFREVQSETRPDPDQPDQDASRVLVPASTTMEGDATESDSIGAADRMRASIQLLASDRMEGRGPGTAGIDKAADYIAGRFEKWNLQTDLFEDDGPFQEFSVVADVSLGPPEANRCELVIEPTDGEAKRMELAMGSQYNPLSIGSPGKVDAPMVFAGYGITAEEYGYDDYDGIDVTGKAVVLIRNEPRSTDPESPFRGRRPTTHATFRSKIRNARAHGAAAVILVNDRGELAKRTQVVQERLDATVARIVRIHNMNAQSKPENRDRKSYLRQIARQNNVLAKLLSASREEDYDRILRFQAAGSRDRIDIPVLFMERQAIDQVLDAALGANVQAMEDAIDKDLEPQSASLEGVKIEAEIDFSAEDFKLKNVVGVLNGDGPNADETIVVGAHYDHLGSGGPGSLARWTVEIHNGADDNASGSSMMLEVARRLALRGKKPNRRIVFIAFSGEESGLLGSAHYVRNPRYALEETVAMINLDMVGRLNENQLTIYGTGTAETFDGLISRLNKTYKFDIERRSGGYGPSDHASFYPHKIPVLFYFTGLHEDYHRPSDDWEKINYDGMARIADMVVESVDAIDAMPSRPTYVKTSRLKSFFSELQDARDAFANPAESDEGENVADENSAAESKDEGSGPETGSHVTSGKNEEAAEASSSSAREQP